MTGVACRRRGCKIPASVVTRLPNGAVDEHLCEEHAWEIAKARVAALNRYTYLGTGRLFVAVSIAKSEAA